MGEEGGKDRGGQDKNGKIRREVGFRKREVKLWENGVDGD